ncbi:B-cell scaffold protein with ankyrin repeats [Oryzias melastigma]|uniref:B-cell scaffold protein with ankyrin repeats n=1 Tax=Oryzias melastigma TaxID=30732 RepID=A0A834FQ10_ORYME|nr:B-cell scaffold protein with ankyrin repeats [Oryzias melastigma]
MNQTAKDLLIIYETEANQWASYLLSVFTGPISEAAICCYDISTVSSRQDDYLRLSQYTCKLLILSKGMLESLCQLRCGFLARILVPASQVVVLHCGVDSLTPLLELVPLDGNQFLQISSDQDPPEYLSAVTDIIRKGGSATSANVHPVTRKPSGTQQRAKQLLSSEASKSSVELHVLLRSQTVDSDCEVEFSNGDQSMRVRPVCWNERILCVGAPDFPAGNVSVTVYSGRKSLGSAQLQYHTNMEELTCLLSKVADPVDFMCQAFQVSSADMVDKKLSSMMLERMPTGGFEALKTGNKYKQGTVSHHDYVPSLLHFAARYGFRGVSKLLLQCPGAKQALRTADCHGQTPTEIAKSHGHTELHVLLRETLKMLNPGEANADHDVYEMMGNTDVQKQEPGEGSEAEEEDEDEEDLYTPLEANDDTSSENAVVIANRPPAPAPRPESSEMKNSKVPFIAQVFQKKKTIPPVDRDLYSLPTKQVQDQEGSVPPTYDSFVMQRDWPTMRLKEKQKSHSIAASVSSKDYDDSVYDRIQIAQPKPAPPKEAIPQSQQDNEEDSVACIAHTKHAWI